MLGSNHPHELYYEFLSETGIFGFSCFLIFILSSIVLSIKNYFKKRNIYQLSGIITNTYDIFTQICKTLWGDKNRNQATSDPLKCISKRDLHFGGGVICKITQIGLTKCRTDDLRICPSVRFFLSRIRLDSSVKSLAKFKLRFNLEVGMIFNILFIYFFL